MWAKKGLRFGSAPSLRKMTQTVSQLEDHQGRRSMTTISLMSNTL